ISWKTIQRRLGILLVVFSVCVLMIPRLHADEIRFGRKKPLQKPDQAIRLASYNVLNLFDAKDDPSLQGEFDDILMTTSQDRCACLAQVIRDIDADVLCLQEVESEEALRWFRDTFLPDMNYQYVASRDVGYYRGIEQSILSRFPLSNITTWVDEDLSDMEAAKRGEGWTQDGEMPTRFQRSPLMVDVVVPGTGALEDYHFTVVVIHHKSGGFQRQRESEALQLVDLLDKRLAQKPNMNLLVVGDYNAGPFDKSLAVYKDAGYVNAYNHRWIRTGDTRNLFRTHESNRVLDYMMFHPNVDSEVVENSFQVVGTLFPGDSYDYRKDQPPSGYAADHYPLVIDILPRDTAN
ncbi:MAG: endonuclease/exonuclease/phosphatase family protein, partial [Pirellulales bacterium]